MPGTVSVLQSHDLADHLESDLKVEFPRTTIMIHTEPCHEGCIRCGEFCTISDKSKLGKESQD